MAKSEKKAQFMSTGVSVMAGDVNEVVGKGTQTADILNEAGVKVLTIRGKERTLVDIAAKSIAQALNKMAGG